MFLTASAQFFSYLLVSYFSSSFSSSSLTMERLREHGIDLNTPTSEYLHVLVSLSLETQLSIREELFKSAATSGLTTGGDVLVSRRDTRKNPLRHKLADDITSLLYCLKNNSKVPRSLLKNRKQSKSYLESSRNSCVQKRH